MKRCRVEQILHHFFVNDICTILLQYIDLHQCCIRFNSHSIVSINRLKKAHELAITYDHQYETLYNVNNARIIASDEHWWSVMQLSHPLSLKRNNIFLLRFGNSDCNKLKFKAAAASKDKNEYNKFQFEFGIICFERSSTKHSQSNAVDVKPYTFMPYKCDERGKDDSYRTSVIRFDSIYNQCCLKQSDTTLTERSKVNEHSSLSPVEYELIHRQLLGSKNNSENGIYLQFKNVVCHSDLYKLSFLVKDMKTNEYENIFEHELLFDVQTYECFVMLAGPLCDCKGRFGFEYVVERIE